MALQKHQHQQQQTLILQPIDTSDAFVTADCDTKDEVNTRTDWFLFKILCVAALKSAYILKIH